jgi:hypothetical protein
MIVDDCYYEVTTSGSLSERLLIRTRDRIYEDFLTTCSPQSSETVLDFGVSES